MWELGLLPQERLVGLAVFSQAALGSLISTSPCRWIANHGGLLSSTQYSATPVSSRPLDHRLEAEWGLGRSSCTGTVVQDQWGAGVWSHPQRSRREERAHPSYSQLRLLGESCLQLSEQWGGELGNCLYTMLRVAIAAPWNFNLNQLWPHLAGKGWGCSSWVVECLLERPNSLGLGIDLELPCRYAFSFQREVSGTQISRFLVSPLPELEEMMVGNAWPQNQRWRAGGLLYWHYIAGQLSLRKREFSHNFYFL